MKLETIKKDKKKNIIIGSMIVLSVVGCLTLTTTRAKYRNIQSLKLASGTVNYKVSDLHIVAIKTSEDGTNYNERTDIPASGYTLNTEKSKCRIPTSTLVGENAPADESIPIEYRDGRVYIGVNKKNTKCYLYFDKLQVQTADTIIAAIEASSSYKSGTPDFTQVATGAETAANNGIYKVSDGMYNGYSYYWRGAATTNHVIFDSKCWRIIRINGDKTIRLIYNGTPTGNTCPGNGANANSVVLKNTAYNGTLNNSKYVGWTYSSSDIQRPSDINPQTSGTAAPLKTALESWYSTNIKDKSKVVKGNFCNDRNTKDGETWRGTGSTQYYAVYARINEGTKTPQLSCPDGDVYSLDVGMITADEVQFAGASGGAANTSYYLYNGQYYWTMSPSNWNSYGAYVFYVRSDNGYLHNANADWDGPGVRPVINLKADTLFNAGSNGTQNNPYIVQ